MYPPIETGRPFMRGARISVVRSQILVKSGAFLFYGGVEKV